MTLPNPKRLSRGAAINPMNRFEKYHRESTLEDPQPEGRRLPTKFLADQSKSVLTRNNSPDIPFAYSLNPYRGCEHGCAYCYARPTHEYLGFSAGLDFETKILVKEKAPTLLRQELASTRWQPQPVAMSGVTDPYQPVERRMQLTRQCLEVLAEFRNPVMIATKNHLVLRDLDILVRLAHHQAVRVSMSITSLNKELTRQLEPRTSTPSRRLAAIKELTAAGIPAGVLVAPIIPGLTDEEIPAIVQAAAQAGAQWAYYEIVRLPLAVSAIFSEWLDRCYPEKKSRILSRLRAMRGGRLNDPRFGKRLSGEGAEAEQIAALFQVARRRAKLATKPPPLNSSAFQRPGGEQLNLGMDFPSGGWPET